MNVPWTCYYRPLILFVPLVECKGKEARPGGRDTVLLWYGRHWVPKVKINFWELRNIDPYSQ